MNEDNLKFLKDQLNRLDFGTTLNEQLEAKMKEQPKDFQLSIKGEYKRPTGETETMDYKLDFRKSESTDMFFFNRYKATLVNDMDPTKEKSQTFYVEKHYGVTAKEAFNLLDGRSVNKDLLTREKEKYNAWMKLDFTKTDTHGNFETKKFSQGYGFDLPTVLKKYPIKELEGDSLDKLIASLQKGNVQAVTFVRDGQEQKMHVEANPQFKSLNVFDENMKKVYQGNEKKESEAPQVAKDKKEDKSEKQDIEEPAEGKTKSKRAGVKV